MLSVCLGMTFFLSFFFLTNLLGIISNHTQVMSPLHNKRPYTFKNESFVSNGDSDNLVYSTIKIIIPYRFKLNAVVSLQWHQMSVQWLNRHINIVISIPHDELSLMFSQVYFLVNNNDKVYCSSQEDYDKQQVIYYVSIGRLWDDLVSLGDSKY